MGDGVLIIYMGLAMCFVGFSTLLSARLGVRTEVVALAKITSFYVTTRTVQNTSTGQQVSPAPSPDPQSPSSDPVKTPMAAGANPSPHTATPRSQGKAAQRPHKQLGRL